MAVLQTQPFDNYTKAQNEIAALNEQLKNAFLNELPLIVLADDASFASASLRNFLWVSFTRCNPSHDMHGINAFTENKHWGCRGPLVIDARIKPHHAPPVEMDSAVEKKIDKLFAKGGSLYGVI